MIKRGVTRFVIALFVVVQGSACHGPHRSNVPLQPDEVVGVWRAENGSQLVLSPDGSLQAESLGLGCWDREPDFRQPNSGDGVWRVPEHTSGMPQTVNLQFASSLTWFVYSNRGELLCVVGDPDEGEYIYYRRQLAESDE